MIDGLGFFRLATADEVADLTRDLRHYLETAGWREQSPGPAGALWVHPAAKSIRALAVPAKIEAGTSEWQGVLDRLAAHEHRPVRDIYMSIATQFVDVTRFRAADDETIRGSIPLKAGARLVEAAHAMLRAAATTSQRPRSHIDGNFSRSGEELAAQARMAHTEEGSYVLPIWMPLTPPEADDGQSQIVGMGFHRASEPPERRVTRTLAQAISAIDEVIVRPEREPKSSDLSSLVVAGVSRELVGALHRVLTGPAVRTIETSFNWASGLNSPGGIDASVSMDATASERLKRAADALRVSRRHPTEIVTGLIVEIRHVPGDIYGEVSVDTVRNGRHCEVRVRLGTDALRATYDWARTERAVVAEGAIEATPGRRLLIVQPRRFMPLDETFLMTTEQ